MVFKLITMNCQNCQKETTNPKFCSRSCAQSYNNKAKPKRLRKTKCTRCNNITKSYRHTLCEEHWKEYVSKRKESVQERTLGDYWKFKSLDGLHTSSKNAHIRLLARSWFKDLTIKPCANCGYDKHVELCHIKPVSSFSETTTLKEVNSRDNIIQLCPNCHWEFDKGLLKL